MLKHIICYSGGHSSALVAIEVVRKYGKENVVLLNHDICPRVEHEDIKRFKKEVADYLGLEITYANHKEWETKDQFDVCLDEQGFKFGGAKTVQCTYLLKSLPFKKWLNKNVKDKNCIIYYGFDAAEKHRIQRRATILGADGYKTDFPLALWKDRTIQSTEEIGIKKPCSYSNFKHANCIGCIKAGKQHWYIVYCERPDVFQKAKETEQKLSYTIMKDISLESLEEMFSKMRCAGIKGNEHQDARTFWKEVRLKLKEVEQLDLFDDKPCECVF